MAPLASAEVGAADRQPSGWRPESAEVAEAENVPVCGATGDRPDGEIGAPPAPPCRFSYRSRWNLRRPVTVSKGML